MKFSPSRTLFAALLTFVATAIVVVAAQPTPTPTPCPLGTTDTTTTSTQSPEKPPQKFLVNHRTGSSSNPVVVICIAQPAVQAHLDHGDSGGTTPCN